MTLIFTSITRVSFRRYPLAGSLRSLNDKKFEAPHPLSASIPPNPNQQISEKKEKPTL